MVVYFTYVFKQVFQKLKFAIVEEIQNDYSFIKDIAQSIINQSINKISIFGLSNRFDRFFVTEEVSKVTKIQSQVVPYTKRINLRNNKGPKLKSTLSRTFQF